jgi:hypothetical protein
VRIKLMGERLAKAGSAWSTSSAKPQRVRSVAIEFCQGVSFSEGAKHGLYAELGTEPLSA